MSSPKKNDIYIYKKDKTSRPILVQIIRKIEDVKNANDLYEVSHLNTNIKENVKRSQLIVPPSEVLDPLKKSKPSHTKPFHTVSQSNIDWNLVLNINYKKGDNVLYINKNTGKTEKAKIIKVHYDDNPPYYTIKFTDSDGNKIVRETVIERLKPINAGIKSRKNRKSRKRKSRKQKKKRMIKKK